MGAREIGPRSQAFGAAELAKLYPTTAPGTIFAFTPLEGNVAKYGKAAEKTITSAMRRRKKGTLKSSSGQTVKSRQQAIAIGISEAREKGAKVPPRPKQKSAKKKSSTRRSAKKR